MIIKLRVERSSGILGIALSIVLWISIHFQIIDTSKNSMKANLVPQITALIILFCGIILVVKSFLKEDRIIDIDLKEEGLVALYILSLIIYAIILPRIGYLLSTIAIACSTLVFAKIKKWWYYGVAVILSIVTFLVFKLLLNIPLP